MADPNLLEDEEIITAACRQKDGCLLQPAIHSWKIGAAAENHVETSELYDFFFPAATGGGRIL